MVLKLCTKSFKRKNDVQVKCSGVKYVKLKFCKTRVLLERFHPCQLGEFSQEFQGMKRLTSASAQPQKVKVWVILHVFFSFFSGQGEFLPILDL